MPLRQDTKAGNHGLSFKKLQALMINIYAKRDLIMRKGNVAKTVKMIIAMAAVVSVFTGGIVGCGNNAASNSKEPVSEGSDKEASNEDTVKAKLSDEEFSEPIDYTFQSHPLKLVNGYTEYATTNYYTISLEKNVKDKFGTLQGILDDFGKEGEKKANDFFSGNASEIKEMFDNGSEIPYSEDICIYPVRADERIFSFIVEDYSYLAGAHGYTFFINYNYDPVTGKVIQFADVVKNTDALPEAIMGELEKQNEDLAKEFKDNPELREEVKKGIPDRLKDNARALSWAVDYDGVCFYFEDYAMGSYAMGWRSVKVKFADYPDVFTDTYDNYKDVEIPDIKDIGRELKEAETVTTDALPLIGKGSDQSNTEKDGQFPGGLDDDGRGEDEEGYGEDWWYHAVVKNPGWSAWTAEGIDTEVGKPSYELSEVSSKTTDWLDTDKWSGENGIPLPEGFPYSDDTYSYSVVNNADEGELSLTVTNNETGSLEGNYYFDEFLEPTDQGTGMFADFTTPYIHYAAVKDNVLYVSLGHMTYASANPHKAYMVAIDMVSGQTLWKSDDQVCGGCNFVILGDSIYCGYGFTAEPDFIYVLNIKNGKVQQKIKVKSAPDYFIVRDGYMYVLTYNTEYLYKIME